MRYLGCLRYLVRAMVCPGVVRKAAKLVPTVLQAIAFVVCIHVVGQVICLFENQMTPVIPCS